MCGRAYATYTDEELQMRYQNRKVPRIPEFKRTFNLAPSAKLPVLRSDGFELMRWGWLSLEVEKKSSINSRVDRLHFTRYGKSLATNRCIVPVSGFYEWQENEGQPKRPHAIYLKNHSIMSIAALWEIAPDKTGKDTLCFSLLLTDPNDLVRPIHKKAMPAILTGESEDVWLNSELTDQKRLIEILKPCPNDWLAAHEISTAINSPRNDRPEVLEPVK